GADPVADERHGEGGQPERGEGEQVRGDAGGEPGHRPPLGAGSEAGDDRHEPEHLAVGAEQLHLVDERRLGDEAGDEHERGLERGHAGGLHRRTRTYDRASRSAAGSTVSDSVSWSGLVSTAVTRPTGTSGGKMLRSVPLVVTASPSSTSTLRATPS